MNCELAQNWNIVGFSSYKRFFTLISVEKRPNIINLGKASFGKITIPHVKISRRRWGGVNFCDFEIFSGKKPVGGSFHVYLMKVHARTRWVNVPDLEKMLHKVRWALGEVSL